MVLECALCGNSELLGYPAYINSVRYDQETDFLEEKVTVLCSRVFCKPCFHDLMRTTIHWEKQDLDRYFIWNSTDRRVELIFRSVMANVDSRFLVYIVSHCIYNFKAETLLEMQRKDPRISLCLKNVFSQFLSCGDLTRAFNVIDVLADLKIKIECLVDMSGYFTQKEKFYLSKDVLLRAYHLALQIEDKETRENVLINVGYEIAYLTQCLMSRLKIDKIRSNISLLNIILSKLGNSFDRGVFFGRINLYLQVLAGKLLIKNDVEMAIKVAQLLPYEGLRENALRQIAFYSKK